MSFCFRHGSDEISYPKKVKIVLDFSLEIYPLEIEMSNYHIEYDDGSVADIDASDAATALSKGLAAKRGHRVHAIFQGGLAQDPRWQGVVRYDVPKHAPMEAAVTAENKTMKLPDRNEVLAFYAKMESETREIKS